MLGIMLFGRYLPNDDSRVPSIVNTISRCVPRGECAVIDTFSGNKFFKELDVPKGTKFLHFHGIEYTGWDICLEKAKEFLRENNITTLVFLRVTMLNGFKVDDNSLLMNFENKIKDNNLYATTYMQMKRLYSSYHLIKAASTECEKVIHFLIDPQEIDFSTVIPFNSYRRVFGTAKKNEDGTLRYIYMPAMEYGCLRIIKKKNIDKTKSVNFNLYCTVITKDRYFVLDQVDTLRSIPNSDIRLFGAGNQDRPIRTTEYYKILAKSKYTMCIPAYDKTTFSIFRFWESLMLDTLPFVHKSCILDDIILTFPDLYDIIYKNKLIVDISEVGSRIKEFSEEKRLSIIDEIKNTKSYRKITNPKFIKERWSKII
jgi:hypothetical protein